MEHITKQSKQQKNSTLQLLAAKQEGLSQGVLVAPRTKI